MAEIGDVFIIDVADKVSYRGTKHCICISVTNDKYLVIDTQHREIYDDFEIKAKDYPFLKKVNRFVCCSRIYHFDSSKLLNNKAPVGRLKYADVVKIINKIQNSEVLDETEQASVLPELIEWQLDNS
jgi:hypothetical protein